MAIRTSDTLELIRQLQLSGFGDDAFWRIHHFRTRNYRETISRFRAYCSKTSTFEIGGTNERVHRRLAYILDKSREGSRADMVQLAEEAFAKIPHH